MIDQSSLSLERARRGWVAARRVGWSAAFVAIWLVAILGFVVLPWSVETKSLAVLHGLCAQQPTHSFYFGDQRLPFDARMTGIYGGFAIASLVFAGLSRWRTAGLPPLGIILALAGGVGALAVDGANSTLVDAGLPHLYAPHNALRLATGMLTGTALATFVWLLIGQVGFSRSGRRPGAVVRGWRDLGVVLGVEALVAVAILTRWELLRVPMTLMLMSSAILALTGLFLAFVLLLGRRENLARTSRELAGAATIALVLSLIVVGSLASGRFFLEAWLGLPAQG